MAAWRYEMSLLALKNISLVRCTQSGNIFNTRREISYLRVISSIYSFRYIYHIICL